MVPLLVAIGVILIVGISALLFSLGPNDDPGPSGASPSGDSSGSIRSNSAAACGLAIGFFGALTGDAASLGKTIRNGVQLAVDAYNEKNPGCVAAIRDYDSQGSPEKAPGLAQRAVADQSVIGIVGPAFSGESRTADPVFERAGLSTITPSATNPTLAENGWMTFHRVVGDDTSQAPAAASYIKDVLKSSAVFVVDDGSKYGKGLADKVKQDLGSRVVGNDTVEQQQTDFSATVTEVKGTGASAVFYGGYYAEAGLLRKQLSAAGGQNIVMVVGDGAMDSAFLQAAGQAAEGTIITCPCLPADRAGGTFAADYTRKFNVEPGTYSAESYDAANVFLAGLRAGKGSRSEMNDFVSAYDKPGVTKQVKFDAKGEATDQVVWTYKVQGGEIVPDRAVRL